MPTRSYSGNARRTALVGDITAASTNITVADATGYPTGVDGPFVVAFELGVAAEEKVLVASRSGNTLTVSQRGFDGTSAAEHRSGSTVDHVLSATDIREANAHVNDSTTDVHAQYVKKAGGDTITASAAGVIPLVVKGAASQSANLLEAQTSDGTVGTQVNQYGNLGVRVNASTLGATMGVQSGGVGDKVLVVRGVASQTANLSEWQASDGTVRHALHVNGFAAFGSGTFLEAAGGGNATLAVSATSAARPLIVVRGAASQTANLAEFQDSAGAVKVSVGSGGGVYVNTVYDGGAMNTTTGVAAAAAGVKGLVVRGAASQTANLAEFQNSAGTVLSNFRASGQLDLFLADTAGGSQGTRLVALGAPDSGGTGRRVLTVPN